MGYYPPPPAPLPNPIYQRRDPDPEWKRFGTYEWNDEASPRKGDRYKGLFGNGTMQERGKALSKIFRTVKGLFLFQAFTHSPMARSIWASLETVTGMAKGVS